MILFSIPLVSSHAIASGRLTFDNNASLNVGRSDVVVQVKGCVDLKGSLTMKINSATDLGKPIPVRQTILTVLLNESLLLFASFSLTFSFRWFGATRRV